MSYRDEIDHWVSEMEGKVAHLRQRRQKRTASVKNATTDRVQKKIALLVRYAENEASDEERIELRRRIAELKRKIAENLLPSLEEIEKEVDRIYGDQSDNSTYYFSRKTGSRKDSDFTQGEEFYLVSDEWGEIEDSREAEPSGFEQVYDPNRNDEAQDMPEFFENRNYQEYKSAMMPDSGEQGYFTHDENMNWDQNVDVDVQHRPNVETPQYWGDEADEFPHVREDNPRVGYRDKTRVAKRIPNQVGDYRYEGALDSRTNVKHLWQDSKGHQVFIVENFDEFDVKQQGAGTHISGVIESYLKSEEDAIDEAVRFMQRH